MAQRVKNSPVIQQTQETQFSPWVGKIPREGNGYPLQYSCLQNSMDRGALVGYIVCRIAKRLSSIILETGQMGGKYLAKQGMGIKMKKSKSE